ncbi:hypothetical protein ACIG0C_05635 [Kitasatospora aureofaciens]|nr:hypothetical protein [Kitasatospora aureofaciens]OEV35053.1 hypothetical protein HS99_0034540 [Kitasatospora aureofaciens]
MTEPNADPEHILDDLLAGRPGILELTRALTSAEPRSFRPLLADEDRSSPYDLDGLDDYEREQVRRGALLVLADDFVDETEWGGDDIAVGFRRADDFSEDFEELVTLISAHYGEAVENADELRYSDSGKAAYWRAGESTLVLQVFVNYPGGNIELHLWLAAIADQA